VGALADGPGEI